MTLPEILTEIATQYMEGLISCDEAARKVVITLCDCDPLVETGSNQWHEFFDFLLERNGG